jgi:hypothetical protein
MILHSYDGPCSLPQQPAPTVEDYCAANGHAYDGDDWTVELGSDVGVPVGRCYCGQRLYEPGGAALFSPRNATPAASAVSAAPKEPT